MTPLQVITTARYLIQDVTPESGFARQDNAELLGYFNDGLAEAYAANPALFQTASTMACTAGTVYQTLSFANAVRLVEVVGIVGGVSLTPFDRATLDAFNPGWRNAAAAAATQYSAAGPGDPLAFFLNAPAPSGQVLDVRFVKKPGTYGLNDTVLELPESMRPAMVDYVVYRAESKDDEHVLSQRAAGHYSAFLAKIGAK